MIVGTKYLDQTGLSSRPTRKLWKHCPWLEAEEDPSIGMGFWDDFIDLPTGKYTATQATTGTFALGDLATGMALADSDSSTAAQGINIQLGGTAGETFTPSNSADLWFEARVMFSDVGTGPEFFLGLTESDTTIIAASALSVNNMIGWYSVTDNNVLLFASEKATSASTKTCMTAVDGTWFKLGFHVHNGTITQWIDGVEYASTSYSFADDTYLPIVAMRPSLVCQSGGAVDPIVSIDWVRVFVMF